MEMRAVIMMVCLLVAPAVMAKPKILYAGFEHLIRFDAKTLNAQAFDLRRHLPVASTCDLVAFPPLIETSDLEDWISKEYRANSSQVSVSFTYLGYENFIMENKKTGDYVIRRCRDFRPQLTSLPCEPFATGTSKYLQHPHKTIHIGNDRVMILNVETGNYAIHTFDADVHTGGDPFRFDTGPFFTGHMDWQNLGNSSFAYIQLKNYQGDALVKFDHTFSEISAWKFNGLAKTAEEFNPEQVFLDFVPGSWDVISLGENEVLFSTEANHFERWRFVNVNGTMKALKGNQGTLSGGVTCLTDNATACTTTFGCAWCPSSYSCQPYDVVEGIFCDKSSCSAPPITHPLLASKSIVIPDCVKDPEVQYNDIMEQIDDGYKLLPGHIRLSSEYRNDEGAHSHYEASPIHPNIDNELGEDPVIVEEDYQDEVIHENNRVSTGDVYTPPPASDSAPCMDAGYSATTGLEVPVAHVADWKMNVEPLDNDVPLKIPSSSPKGDAVHARDPGCSRQNATLSALAPSGDFKPTAGGAGTGSPDFTPQSVTTRFEEDLMNSEFSHYADLKANWVDDAEPTDPTRTKPKIDSETLYHPREMESEEEVANNLIPAPQLRVSETHPTDLMNQGLEVKGLAGVDCTDTGGDDGFASKTQHSAMTHSEREQFPESLESQLKLAEQPSAPDTMDFTAVETNHHIKLPFADQEAVGEIRAPFGQA